MIPQPNPVVRVTRHIPFTAERVFDAWLNPTFAAKWLFATPAGQMVRAETDPRVGGRFSFTERRGGEDVEHTGEYLEIDRPRRLVFTFAVPKYSDSVDRVTVEIEPKGASCVLTLTHEMKPQFGEFTARTSDGWTQIVEGLAATLGDPRAATNHRPCEFPAPGEVRLTRLLPGPIERVWDYLTDGEKRKQWFAGGTMDLRVGGRVEFQFRHANLSPDEKPPEKYAEVHDPGVSFPAEITRCAPPRVLAFTWPGEKPEDTSEVTFELAPQGEDVLLTLIHRRLATDADRANVSGGWAIHTAHLAALLTGDTPPPLWAMHSRLERYYGTLLGVK